MNDWVKCDENTKKTLQKYVKTSFGKLDLDRKRTEYGREKQGANLYSLWVLSGQAIPCVRTAVLGSQFRLPVRVFGQPLNLFGQHAI
jgi:hypothetical protein